VDIFLVADGQMIGQESLVTSEKMGTSEIEKKTKELVLKAIKKIPYQGMVMSRTGNRVTVDMGDKTELRRIDSHDLPNYFCKTSSQVHFIVGTDKEILGKIKIVKADDTLSFGIIVSRNRKGSDFS